MNKPIITINGKTIEMRSLKGRDWRVFGEFLNIDNRLQTPEYIEKYAEGCRYTDCTHLCEDGCGVMKALEEGKIQPSRHASFVKLYHELKAIKPWNI